MSRPVSASRFGDDFRLTLITTNPRLAETADQCGVDRIGVDLEQIGKGARQAGQNSRVSDHTISDLEVVGSALERAALFVRVNAIGDGSPVEIEQVIEAGADVVMLPFFRTAREVETFVRLIDGRASAILLVETGAAVVRLHDILDVDGVDEVMVGLNDLRLDLSVHSHFEVLASPLLDMIAGEVQRRGLPFGVGALADPNDTSLPISPDLVLAQYARLGATGAWLSRSFVQSTREHAFAEAIHAIRRRLTEWASASPDEWERARLDLRARARALAPRRH